jgi:RNA polymerase sigma factor (sigma-70 family)
MVQQAQRGDAGAFRSLVYAYASLTERMARVLLESRERAEDALQEAWLDVWRGLGGFDPDRPFRPWLLTVVANRCRMERRRRDDRSVPLTDGMDEPTWDRHSDDGPLDLPAILRGLDTEQRRMLELRYYADLKLEEIAELMGLPLGTVKSRLHRTLATLRERLTEQIASDRQV